MFWVLFNDNTRIRKGEKDMNTRFIIFNKGDFCFPHVSSRRFFLHYNRKESSIIKVRLYLFERYPKGYIIMHMNYPAQEIFSKELCIYCVYSYLSS